MPGRITEVESLHIRKVIALLEGMIDLSKDGADIGFYYFFCFHHEPEKMMGYHQLIIQVLKEKLGGDCGSGPQ